MAIKVLSHYKIKTKQCLLKVNTDKERCVLEVHSRVTNKILHIYEVPYYLSSDLAKIESFSALVRCAKDLHIQPEAETPCPVPAPAPAKSAAKGQGILFCDTETTGLGRDAEIVEIAVVDQDENVLFESLVKPSKPITAHATSIHGITNAMVANAPTFSEIWHRFSMLVLDRELVFYNAEFDTRMILQSALSSFGYEPSTLHGNKPRFEDLFNRGLCAPSVTCLMVLYARYWGDWSDYHQSYRWQSLIDALVQQRIASRDLARHRAASDAIKTARLYNHLLSKEAVA